MNLPELPLCPLTDPHWLEKWEAATRDPWLKKKLDRQRRLRDHFEYLEKNNVPLWRMPIGSVVDLGPGAGELLELARHWRHNAVGIDAACGEGGMGDAYLTACRLLHERQGLDVRYTGLAPLLDGKSRWLPGLCNQCVLINSRGSFEQIFAAYMDGPPHHLHQDCNRLSWRLDGITRDAFQKFFGWAWLALKPYGHLLVHCNGAQNTAACTTLLREVAETAGLSEMEVAGRVLHWTRV